MDKGQVAYRSFDQGGTARDTEAPGRGMTRKEARKRIGFVRQQDYLVEHLTGMYRSEKAGILKGRPGRRRDGRVAWESAE